MAVGPKFGEALLPTLDKLGAIIPDDLDVKSVAKEWFDKFSQTITAQKLDQLPSLFIEESFWRDLLALTWDFRTFEGLQRISSFLADTLSETQPSEFVLLEESLTLQQLYPDLAWIHGSFKFQTVTGIVSGIFRIVPTATGVWKGHTVFTNLEDFKGFPEDQSTFFDLDGRDVPLEGKEEQISSANLLASETTSENPVVVIIGAGQSGLDVAARLKTIGITSILVEKNARVGDSWRQRYDSLCLHDPVSYDHMPYLPFPDSWPVFTPAHKLADWLEQYAIKLQLNVWTSCQVEKAEENASRDGWTVTVKQSDGVVKILKTGHIVFAHGFGGGLPNVPDIVGKENFQGAILHTSQFKSGRDHIGKKVLVVGSSTSAHDVAKDLYDHGADVTMYQKSSTYVMSTKEGLTRSLGGLYWGANVPPTDIADRISASFPFNFLMGLSQRRTKEISKADKTLLDGLTKRGFKLNDGVDSGGFLSLVYTRHGGYYIDVGASQLIIDGKIKLKNDSQISHLSGKQIIFENGSSLDADVILLATGYGDPGQLMRQVLGEEVAKRLVPVRGVNEEGEINMFWHYSGVPRLFCMMGNLALCRFYSKHVALQIKAIEEGIPVKRYSLEDDRRKYVIGGRVL